jgi:hypothetical protein
MHLSKKKVEDLKQELKGRKLVRTGNKDVLVQRIIDHVEALISGSTNAVTTENGVTYCQQAPYPVGFIFIPPVTLPVAAVP